MSAFYLADSIIQGILGLSCIVGVLSFPLHLPIFFPVIYSFYALLGWQLCSSIVQLWQYRPIPSRRVLHVLQQGLLGLFAVPASMILLESKGGITLHGAWQVYYTSVFYVALLMLPLMMLAIGILSFRRLFTAPFF